MTRVMCLSLHIFYNSPGFHCTLLLLTLTSCSLTQIAAKILLDRSQKNQRIQAFTVKSFTKKEVFEGYGVITPWLVKTVTTATHNSFTVDVDMRVMHQDNAEETQTYSLK